MKSVLYLGCDICLKTVCSLVLLTLYIYTYVMISNAKFIFVVSIIGRFVFINYA